MNPQQTPSHDTKRPAQAQSPAPVNAVGQDIRPGPSGPEPMRPQQPVYSTPNASPPHKKPRGYAWRGFFSVLQLIIGAAVLAFLINQLVFQPYEVFGQSMVPTLHEGDRLIVSKLGKTWSTITRDDYTPKRGEIIVFHNPNSPTVQLVKRVVGLPGDRVVVDGGHITVYPSLESDGFDFDQRFDLNPTGTLGRVDLTIPEGEIFVVGDNRSPNGSLDSRNELGTIPLNQVVGDLVFRLFPVSDAALF